MARRWNDEESDWVELPEPTDEERCFLRAVEAAPLDEAPHGVFADWLDEHDRPEEADWHRRWRAADALAARGWFEKLSREKGHRGYGEDRGYYSADDLIGAGLASLESGWSELTQRDGTSLQTFMYDESGRRQFLTNLALATGRYVNVDAVQDGYQPFSCSC